jgi:sugar O-acyltransferase (sialic acid O-acetyltransferase NeuD family)
MKEKVVIFGQGELAEVIHFYLKHDSSYEVVAFTVDGQYMQESTFAGLPIVPFENITVSHPPSRYKMFVALSYKSVNLVRAKKFEEAKAKGYSLISYVNSKAITWPGLEIGENCFIFESNVIQPFVKIGNNVTLWSGNHIGHHSTIKDHCFLASHIVVSGGVVVEPYTFIGVNATLRDHVTIGAECVIGAGALVLKDVAPKTVLVGHAGIVHGAKSNELKRI